MIIFYRLLSDSPNMRKISLMLEEVGLPFESRYIESRDEHKTDPELAKISPNGTYPAIFDTESGVSLFESAAILYYLAEKTGKLLPTDIGDRAEAMKWLMFEAANICPAMLELHHYIMNDSGDIPEAIFQRYRDSVTRFCSILEKQLEDRNYLAGDFSIADIAIYPWTVILEDVAEVSMSDFPNLSKWESSISQRPGAV